MREIDNRKIAVLLLALAALVPSCQHPSGKAGSFTVGSESFLSADAAYQAYKLVVEGEIRTADDLLSHLGNVKSYMHTEGVYFPILTRSLADAYAWKHDHISQRFKMNCGIFDIKTSGDGRLLKVLIEYETEEAGP